MYIMYMFRLVAIYIELDLFLWNSIYNAIIYYYYSWKTNKELTKETKKRAVDKKPFGDRWKGVEK